jgi:uncharacterized protein (TIGR02996 family)
MSDYLSTQPQVLAMLQEAKDTPQQDDTRLALADWLDEHNDPDRAEFIRLQCRLAPGSPPLDDDVREDLEKCMDRLLRRHGGCWLGSLWHWWLWPVIWHRGLLAVRLPRRVDAEDIADVLPWIDTVVLVVTGRRTLQMGVQLLAQAQVNHLFLDLRASMSEEHLLNLLAEIPERACLRSLSFDWPLRLRRAVEAGGLSSTPVVSEHFLERLLTQLPVGRHLTHLGSAPGFCLSQEEALTAHGVVAVDVQEQLWMHSLPPQVFCAARP